MKPPPKATDKEGVEGKRAKFAENMKKVAQKHNGEMSRQIDRFTPSISKKK